MNKSETVYDKSPLFFTKVTNLKLLLIGCAMLMAAVLALMLKPNEQLSDQMELIDLEAMIPKVFGDWRVDESILPVVPDPQVKNMINKIYNQTLAHTYVNDRGKRVMLAIAYGSRQSDNLQVHKPEVCYTAQGFQVVKKTNGNINLFDTVIPVKQLQTVLGNRNEYVTYWITLGDQIILDTLKWKLTQLKYTMTGIIPDGLLFRVSSIQSDEVEAYDLQKQFISDLLNSLDAKSQIRLVGKSVAASIH